MSNNVKEILKAYDAVKMATATGTDMHNRLGRVVIDVDKMCGDPDLIEKIQAVPKLAGLFSVGSMVEVPIAGNIGNRFVSRRIDRLLIDDKTKTVYVLDYKTDTNQDSFRERYVAQLHEYAALLRQIYPKYKIQCMILWTHNWVLESV